MSDQISTQFLSYGKQAIDAGFKAQQLALQNFEHILGLQLKSLEDRVGATLAFVGEASEVRDLEAVKTVWPKGVALAKESGEQFYQVGQEVLNASLKTSEAIGQLFKAQVEAANDGLVKPAVKRAAAAK